MLREPKLVAALPEFDFISTFLNDSTEISADNSSDKVTTTGVRVGGDLEKPLAGRSLEEETVSLD